jgi:hypothetical protein
MRLDFSSPFLGWRAVLLLAASFYFTSGRASAECGDYTVIRHGSSHSDMKSDPSTRQNPGDLPAQSPFKSPCHGSNCSSAPSQGFPPLAPVAPVASRVKELTQSTITVDEEPNLGFAFDRDCTSACPIDQASSIFHPPRLF